MSASSRPSWRSAAISCSWCRSCCGARAASSPSRNTEEAMSQQPRAALDEPAKAAPVAAGGASRVRSVSRWLVSDDAPGRWWLNAVFLLILLALLVAPFLFPGTKALGVASRICIFVILVASYDLMLGYTGIVSFAHTTFFGIGAYGVAILLAKGWVGWGAVILGALAGVLVSFAVAAVIGMLSLRVRAIFFAMITLAVASFAEIVASQWRGLTGGEDGLTFSLPRVLMPSFRVFVDPVLWIGVIGSVVTYYLTIAV